MSEPGPNATDAELAEYYDQHRNDEVWGEAKPASRERLDVTISVRFSSAEIAAIRARADAAGLKPTAYIRRCALTDERPPIDRTQLARMIEVLSRDIEGLRQAAG